MKTSAAMAVIGLLLGAPAATGLPSRVALAPTWTAEVGDAPIGSALACLVGPDQGRVTVIGAGDEVRVYDRPEWSLTSDDAVTLRLSPDGRRLAMPHWRSGTDQRTRLLDFADGTVRVLDAGAPLAWSADASMLLTVHFDGDATGARALGGELRVVRVPTGETLWTAPLAPHKEAYLALTAAFAPDGAAIAVQHGDELDVHRRDGTGWHAVLDSRRLAGPAAWSADGTRLWLADRTGRLVAHDPATGRETAAPAIMGYPGSQLIGWREGDPVVLDGNLVRQLGDHPRELLRGPAETLELAIARNAVVLPLREPGSPRLGPFLDRYAHPLAATAIILLLLAGTAVWTLRRRSHRSHRT